MTSANVANISEAKKALRAVAKAARSKAHARHGRDAGQRLAGIGLSFAKPKAGARVSGFWAIGEEIDVRPLMTQLFENGFGLALPRMQGRDRPLLFRQWQPGDELTEAVWGIKEPLPSAEQIAPDIVLVPLLAFDSQGYRLGYGGGFYDRTIADLKATKQITTIGVAFDEQRVDAVPHLDYDERLDWILTPSGPHRCAGC